jgi:hypothetical protein
MTPRVIFQTSTRAVVIGYGYVIQDVTVADLGQKYLLTVVKHLNPSTIITEEYDTLDAVADVLVKYGLPQQATEVRALGEKPAVATGVVTPEQPADVGAITGGETGTTSLGAQVGVGDSKPADDGKSTDPSAQGVDPQGADADEAAAQAAAEIAALEKAAQEAGPVDEIPATTDAPDLKVTPAGEQPSQE